MQHSRVQLRKAQVADLESFFQFQLDEEGLYLAAFTPKVPSDRAAYFEKYTRHLNDPSINTQAILVDGCLVGSIAKFEIAGDAEITYWLDRSHWGQGVATAALTAFLALEKARPIFGRVAFDNVGSQRVLEKCGFVKIGTNKGFANARQAEIEESIYQLR
ncbi:GNAT family N-acetyltransferase [Hymenobacter sp. BT523]|nr:GNAT family N-acetyltransferase [Hymenobacter sp. BT523]